MTMRWGCIITLGWAASTLACAAGCPKGRTTVDAICVDNSVADYVVCIREGARHSQDSDQGKHLSTQLQVLGNKFSSELELADQLHLEFSKRSEPEAWKIISDCRSHLRGGEPAQSSDTQTVGYWVAGTGALATLAGGYFVYRAFSKNEQSSNYCNGNACIDRGFQLRRQARNSGDLATVLVSSGVGLAGIGLTLVLVGGPGEPQPGRERQSVALQVSPAGFFIDGRW